MRNLKHFALMITIIGCCAVGYHFHPARRVSTRTNNAGMAPQRYRLDASQSKFIAHALPGSLLRFKGHHHLVAVREFSGEAQLTPDSITPASLEIAAQTGSMVETSSLFTDQQKQIINRELQEIVLLPDKYPDITFRSTAVTGKADRNKIKLTFDIVGHAV